MKKIRVITEGKSDAEILKAVLPEKVVQNVQFTVGSGKYSARSLARSILAVEYTPVAFVIDADTNDTAAIQEQYELSQMFLNQASAGVPFKVFLAVPEIEILLVQDIAFLERLIYQLANKEQKFSKMEVEFARLAPKKFLRSALQRTEPYPIMLREILKSLDKHTLKTIREHPLVRQLCEFVLSLQPMPT